MINITFSASLYGGLKMADYYSKKENNEIQDLKENLISLDLDLELGDISEQVFAEKRKADYIKIHGKTWKKWYNDELKKIIKLENLIKGGEEIRIWYTERSNEFCAFCWLLTILDLWKIENEKIFYVKLPQSILFSNGKYETFGSSGMFEPEILSKLANSQQRLTESYKNYHIEQWHTVQKENAKMRICINCQLLSVKEDFYDSIILSEIDKFDNIFSQAAVIGNCVMKLWVSDLFVAWRIDKMIEKGMFQIVEEAKENRIYYCRLLKK